VPNPGNPEILLENNDTVVVVPVFSEAPVIASVIDELAQYFPNIYCVDDGSLDGSGEIAAKSGAHVVWHPMNFGQGAALQTGIEAGLENPEIKYFVTFDGDGQHSPLDALEMVRTLRAQEFDVVFGSRFLDERTELTTAKRVVLKLAVSYTNALTGLKLTDAHNGLRAFNRSVASWIHLSHMAWHMPPKLLIKLVKVTLVIVNARFTLFTPITPKPRDKVFGIPLTFFLT
jgi:glycosyltransferase involved in cell wall biosynthesis